MTQAVEKNAIVSVEIEDLAYGGLGVGRVGGFVVFVEKALPGERVATRIIRKKKNHAQGCIHEIEKPSPYRLTDIPCPLFGTCGGCTWQNFTYDQQLIWKQHQVESTIRHLAGLEDLSVQPIIGSPAQWHYRNKMEFSFGVEDERVILGFHKPGRFDRIFEAERCLLAPEATDDLLTILTQFVREQGLVAYDTRTHKGFLRYAVVRHSVTTGEMILVLITDRGELPAKEELARRLFAGVNGFKGLMWGLNTGVADVARVDRELWSQGELDLKETVNGLTFAISPQSFFQTNTRGAELLYAKVVEMAQLTPTSRVLDAYCGTGSIGLHCARQAGQVVGVELITEAIWNARANAEANGVNNATFIAAPLARGLSLAAHAAHGDFSHVIIDPPRGGMDKKSIRGLIELQAPHFLYVSCNPATLSRDLMSIVEGGYRVETVQPVDMFPHTYHIETIVKLRRG